MGRFMEINPEQNTDSAKFTRQANIVTLMDKKVLDTQQYIARWVIESGIPFNTIQNNSFKLMMEAIGQFGPGLPTPSRYRLSGPCLKAEIERVKKSLKKHEDEWAISCCSIMTDAWTDRERRSIMNLCVHCREGISLIILREDSDASHTGNYIFEYVDKCIEDTGPEKVVQIVTDNASNNMAAATLMKAKRLNIFWTSCATHTVNLMLEGIGKLPRFKNTIDKARALTIFIYSHHSTLSMMRKMAKKHNIVRPGVTRFSSTYLTLQSLLEKKEQRRLMFASEEWSRNSHSKSAKEKMAYAMVVSISFWKSVNSCLVVFRPLVKVLRLVDSDKPSMPWLYGELLAAKKEIKNEIFSGVEKNYKPILDMIETKSKGRLDSYLHLTGYFLNPYYFAKKRVEIGEDVNCMDALLNCVKFFPDDIDTQVKVSDDELVKYKNLEGMFGRKQAENVYQTKDVNSFNPAAWWSNYGGNAPHLKKMAIRILSLITSSSDCERNWSTFEGGRFEILTLSGSFLYSEVGGAQSRTGGLSVCLSGADGRIIGGGVGGPLMAACPVQVIVGSFVYDGKKDFNDIGKADASAGKLPSSPMGGTVVSPMNYRSTPESPAKISVRGNEDHRNMGGSGFVLKPCTFPGIPSRLTGWRSHIESDARSDVDMELTGRTDDGQSPDDGDD